MNKLKQCLIIFFVLGFVCKGFTQERLTFFPLSEVTLLEGPFKSAQDLNVETLLKYDVDRLLAPFLKEASLDPQGESFENWIGLDGHVGGHYLSAMAIHYASTGNQECKRRMDYMLAELKRCQENNENINPKWAVGYVGGVPDSKGIWSRIKNKEIGAVWDYWVPWYNVHKIYAGLWDAWIYGQSEQAKVMFLNLCDWGINLTEGLSDEQMESMLANEYGGMNEVYADAYQITGDDKYLIAAKRFSHKFLLNPLSQQSDGLDNLHANTQVPKVVGFQRVAELTGDEKYAEASQYFWENVTGRRSIAIGGNSRREFFPPANSTMDFIDEVEGPESCNSNNMLKLTKGLFKVDQGAKYADYYERVLYNHILSTQHPEHGGYVYFTPARPRHYRVYSAPNEAMWCCVGTGMENHGKYGEFIYAHKDAQLFVNLFVASELNWAEQGIKIRQQTRFPDQDFTTLTIDKGSASFDLMIRYPGWVESGEMRIKINGEPFNYNATPQSYVKINRKWTQGDKIEVTFPMKTTIEPLMSLSNYVAFVHGPIVLGAKTGAEDMPDLVAGSGRWEHIAHGKRLPINEAPVVIGDYNSALVSGLHKIEEKPLVFSTAGLNIENAPDNLRLEPFFRIHDSRYMMYWMQVSETDYKQIMDSLAVVETERLLLDQLTVDRVQPGEQQPEVDHAMKTDQSRKGVFLDEFWRDARNGGFFSYELVTHKKKKLVLQVKFWGNETGQRKFDILIDGQILSTEDLTAKWNSNEFKLLEYQIPKSMLKAKTKVEVKFQSKENAYAGGVFGLRLMEVK